MNEPKKILVVEDDASLLHALKDKLVHEGFSVFEAKNGAEGLAAALREHPDLLLLDIVMPQMDGMTMLKNLRQDAWGKTVKVIFLTNLSDNENISEAMKLSSYDFLVKVDWKIEDVVRKIREKLNE